VDKPIGKKVLRNFLLKTFSNPIPKRGTNYIWGGIDVRLCNG
jgi:hypothetical protein